MMNENEVKNIPDTELEPSAAEELSSADTNEKKPKYRKSRFAHRRFPYFYTIYAALVAVAVIAIFCVCNYVSTLLSEYEQVQPKYKADEVFLEHFKDPDVDSLMNFTDESFAEFESRELVVSHIKEKLLETEITYAETMKNKDGERIYSVYSDGKRFAFFSLVEGDKTTKHGFKYYELADIEMRFTLSDSKYTFVIPDRYTLYVNGISVSDKYKTGESTPTDAYKITGGSWGVNYVEYLIDGILSVPEFSVKDECGETAGHYWDEEAGLYTVDTGYITVRVPAGYTPYLESGAVSADYKNADKEPEPSAYNKFLADSTKGIYYDEYLIGGVYSDAVPNITVKSAEGVECIVHGDESSRVFESTPVYSLELQTAHGESIKEFFRQYTLYLMYVNVTADGEPSEYIKKSDLKPCFDTGSKAWRAFNSIQVSWQFEPTRYEFVGESVDEFIEYDDGTFSCRVKQTYNSWRKNATYSQEIDKTVFYKISGDKILIYEMTNTQAVGGLGAPTVEE